MSAAPALRLVLLLLAAPVAEPTPAPTPPPLVDAAALVPGLRLDIRYATPRNFTGRALYPSPRCLLRPAVAERLAHAQEAAAAQGLGLKVFDCYRPLSVQRAMWTLVPDERYVADPAKGSRHNRGAAVDVTLVDAEGHELPMPTAFDDFSARAHRDYDDLPPAAIANRARLERLMTDAGFTGLPTEWWHFDADGWERYDALDVPL
ncbi:MAG TPA: D-alanyl-D-alanine dipeptidase [Candidatus Dormibacteraeota bacterium]|nr:D-alanyl-D-alanine dipeptidase [Candidatus Dormibacteraeota bacterium]